MTDNFSSVNYQTSVEKYLVRFYFLPRAAKKNQTMQHRQTNKELPDTEK